MRDCYASRSKISSATPGSSLPNTSTHLLNWAACKKTGRPCISFATTAPGSTWLIQTSFSVRFSASIRQRNLKGRGLDSRQYSESFTVTAGGFGVRGQFGGGGGFFLTTA